MKRVKLRIKLGPQYYHSGDPNIHFLGRMVFIDKSYDLYVCSPAAQMGDNGAVIARYGNNAADFAWTTIDDIAKVRADALSRKPTWADSVALIDAFTRANLMGFIEEV